MNFKKVLLIISFIILVTALSLALYFVFFSSTTVNNNNNNQDFGGGAIPNTDQNGPNIVDQNTDNNQGLDWQSFFGDKISDVANGGLTKVTKLSEDKVSGLFTSSNGVKYYDQQKQQFFRINGQGEPELLADKKFFQVENILWAPNDDKAILEYPDGSNVLYNFRTGKQVTLPIELENFSFDPSGQKIVASWIGSQTEDNWLVVANDDGSGLALVEQIGDQINDVQVGFSPDGQVAALYRKSYDLQRQEVFPIGLHGENLRSFIAQGSGFESTWSPEGNSLLYSVYSDTTDYLPNLWVTNGKTSALGDLKVSLNVATWPDKCSFSSENSLYCAVPQGLPRGAGLYPEVADSYTDNFYYIDLNTGTKTLIASPVGSTGGYTAYNLHLSADGSILYFTDQNTGSLQSIRLK